ncbi:glycosyltransferase family 2 protein [Limosilactobacillus vaginalis]|uniref:glycosyltransferase family 2 protein n=1 Tax=Limosilactobacillus vaginalis TaxID=1633 RepID=UPI0024BA9FCC|nr:glycosyltransferase family 2 protein [Limosilactobacillus vaginalis]MDM8261053.1 glycosyltransferase family 2 protein [Limosilactobacillus vaginalis]
MGDKVAILMSTFNGEKYLPEQIESIIHQTYHNWVLYIRDDGSQDNTVKIIKQFSRDNNNIIFVNEKNDINVGVFDSFMNLLKKQSADYYMFSDQDDVWLENKISNSLKLLKENEPGPVCVFTDAEIVTKDLKPIRRMLGNNVWTDFLSLCFANRVTGCTMIFNDELKRLIKFSDMDISKVYMHDWWIGLIASKMGKLLYLNEPTLKYRQHGNNVVGGDKKNTLSHIANRFKNMNKERKNVEHSLSLLYEFYRQYSSGFKGNESNYIRRYSSLQTKSSFLYNLRTVLQYPPKRHSLKGKFFFSYIMVVYHDDYLA